MKWYVTTVLMPDDKLYVGINEYHGGEEECLGFVALFDTEQDADEFSCAYATEHNSPTFAEYKEEV